MICVCDRVSVRIRYGMIAPSIVLVLYHDIPAGVKQGKKIARVLTFERCCGAEGGDRCREGQPRGRWADNFVASCKSAFVCGEKMTVDGKGIAFSPCQGYNAIKQSKQGSPFYSCSPLNKVAYCSAMRDFFLPVSAFRTAMRRVSSAYAPFVPKNRPFMAKGLKSSHRAVIMKSELVRLSQRCVLGKDDPFVQICA